jgi:alpha-1,6-mannosyltransferase
MQPVRTFTLTFQLSSGNFSRNIRSSKALKRYPTVQLFAAAVLLAAVLLSLRLLPFTPIIKYAAIFISSSLLYWFVCWQALRAERGGEAATRGLVLLLALFVLVRMNFLGMDPLGSDDVYRYVWDGRVQTAGINPYRYAPNDETLSNLHTDRLPSLVNHPDMKTIYFPVNEWIFYVGYHLSGENVWGFQLLVLLAETLTIIGLFLLMRELGNNARRGELSHSRWWVLIYAANPLVILQFSLDAHVDAFGLPFLIFGLLLCYRNRTTVALVLLGLSLLVKPVALVILPILFLHERGIINKARVVALPSAVLLIPFIPYTFNANPFEALVTFSKHWFFNGALFSVLFPLFSDNQTTRLWCFAFLALSLIVLYLSKKPMHEKIVFAVLLLLLCSPVVHPWYVAWMIVLLPLSPISSGLAFAGTASLPSITYVTYQLQGVWKDYPLVLVLEYVPVVTLLVFDLFRKVTPSADLPTPQQTAMDANATNDHSRQEGSKKVH